DSVVSSPVHSGSHALAGAANSSDDAQCTQTVSVQPNTAYTLTGWVEGNYVYIGAGSASNWTPSAASWQQLSTSFTTGSSATSVTVFVHGWYGQGTYFADDLSLTGPSGGGGGGSAPGAPSGLTVTGTTSSSVSLSWTAPSSGGAPSGYNVYENGTNVQSVTGTSDTVTGLAASTSYTFTVTAFNSVGESPHSSSVQATTQSSGGGGGGGGSLPAHVMAPYVDTGFSSVNGALSGSTLSTIASNYGDKYFSLAFVDGSGCQWSMFNSSMYQSEVSSLQAAGGNVIISFGGFNSDTNGTDLGNACSSASAMATQVENVVNFFNPAGLDFDIESSEVTNSADVNRTNAALAMVRSWANANGHSSLMIDYTLPVLTSGLTSDGLNVLTNGKSNGFTPNIVNVMAFDFGSSGTEMGQGAKQGLDSSASQVASTYGISNGYAMTGLTVMPGQNDTPGEVFTLSDASSVESYAASKGIPLLTFWSEGRDNGGCPGQTSASSTCSGLSQSTGQFTTTFNPFTH
ncbi:MAG TPA: fibronectin type III domain-containing protein, partial [Streptosporangiaceae bacterium]|nr:fibronectin type III domain-containing protein [Streptosporangiaceae bacterium]